MSYVLLLPFALAAGYWIGLWQARLNAELLQAARRDGFIAGRLAERDARSFADSMQARLYAGGAQLRIVPRGDA